MASRCQSDCSRSHAHYPDVYTRYTGTLADAAVDELAFRRRGLVYALIGIGVMILALVLKIREIER